MNVYDTNRRQRLSSNTFDLSHDVKTTFNMGELVPTSCFEVLPGERFTISSDHLLRVNPLLAPMMHIVHVYQHWWYQPTRIVWSNYQDFATSGVDGNSMPAYPTVQFGALGTSPPAFNQWLESCIPDYLGIPVISAANKTPITAVPFAMYLNFYNEFYRNANLQPEIDCQLVDGDNTDLMVAGGAFTYPKKRNWEADYFTTCLLTPQRGPAVSLPLGTSADINWSSPTQATRLLNPLGGNVSAGQLNAEAPDQANPRLTDDTAAFLQIDVSNLKVDMSSVLSASIENLRGSFMLQSYLEMMSVFGSRYSEMVEGIWNVRIGDDVIQRPIYLGGSKTPLVISEVLQTSETNTTPQGTMAGRAISVSDSGGFSCTTKESGYIMSVISIMPKPGYFQGLHKHWTRFDKFDFYLPPFAQLGEQAVKNSEIYFQDISSIDDLTFGYQSRWGEYKALPSSVHGAFRSSLLFWHMAREFAGLPVLNANFVSCDATERIYAVQALPGGRLDHIYCHIHHNIRGRRPMPVYNVPALLGG